LVVADPRLEVVDLKSEVPERRSGGIRPNLTPALYIVPFSSYLTLNIIVTLKSG